MKHFLITVDGHEFDVIIMPASRTGESYHVTVDGEPVTLTAPNPSAPASDLEWLIIDGRPYEFVFDPQLQWANAYDGLHTIEIQDRNQRLVRPRSGDGRVKAPIPGLISRVFAAAGETVQAGQPLLILEAMKMENEIRAPFDGVLHAVSVSAGQTVIRDQVLAEVK
jgi:biotin carboxyl carrier protein